MVQLIVNDGFTSSAPATVTITANAQQTITFSPPSLTFAGTETQNLTLTLSGPAPPGGLALNISSNNTGVATVVAPIVTIPANATAVIVPVTGVAAGTAVIRASAANVGSVNLADATANVTVNASVGIIIPAQLTITPGSTAPFSIALAAPAPSSITVQLISSNPSKATISLSSVTFNAGQTQPTRQPNLNGLAIGTATITASAFGLTPATTQVTVGLTATLSPADLTISPSSDGTLTLTLSGPAPEQPHFRSQLEQSKRRDGAPGGAYSRGCEHCQLQGHRYGCGLGRHQGECCRVCRRDCQRNRSGGGFDHLVDAQHESPDRADISRDRHPVAARAGKRRHRQPDQQRFHEGYALGAERFHPGRAVRRGPCS